MPKLTPPLVTVEAQRDLLAAALAFRAERPWDFMGDVETLGWEDPVTGRLRMGVVLGMGGTMFGLAVYRGEWGIHFLLKTLLREDEQEPEMRDACEMDAVRVEFTKKGDLQPEEIASLKVMGFKPEKGTGPAWPCFRSFLPGMSEWFLDQAETEMMSADLRRVSGFARVLRANPDMFDGQPFGAFPFWPRHKPVTETLELAELEWHQLPLPPRPAPLAFPLTAEHFAQVRALPQQPRAVWEAGSAYTLDVIGEPPRPYYTRVGMAVDRQTGFILGIQAGGRDSSLEHTAARAVLEGMLKMGFRPRVLHMVDDAMRDAFAPVAQRLEIRVESGEELPSLLEAMQGLMEGMGRGMH